MSQQVPVRLREPMGRVRPIWFGTGAVDFVSWAYAMEVDGRRVLIDTGVPHSAAGFHRALKELGAPPQDVLLTHHHATHVANAALLAEEYGARILVHEDEAELCSANDVPVDETFTETHFPYTELTAIHTPGHTPGHAAFFWPEERILFSGDAIFGLGPSAQDPLSLPGGSKDQVGAYIRRLLEYDFDTVLPAHGRQVLSGGRGAVQRLATSLPRAK